MVFYAWGTFFFKAHTEMNATMFSDLFNVKVESSTAQAEWKIDMQLLCNLYKFK